MLHTFLKINSELFEISQSHSPAFEMNRGLRLFQNMNKVGNSTGLKLSGLPSIVVQFKVTFQTSAHTNLINTQLYKKKANNNTWNERNKFKNKVKQLCDQYRRTHYSQGQL